ncbi:uncharacterized protein [Scyliorhinus torazame]|uniref:uncharacterized protein n=1 Tax=Scyliorhinus torazame TaxID=75743 RepID=UPI003B5A8D02
MQIAIYLHLEFCLEIGSDACLVPVDDPKATSATEEINTVTSSITVQEYFANRMVQLKKIKTGHEIDRSSAVQELKGDDLNSFEEVKMKSKKKKKRCRGDADGICNFNQLSLPTKQVEGEGDVELNSGLIEDSPVKANYQTKRNSRESREKYSVSPNQNICPLGEVESEEVQVEQYPAVNESSEKQNEQDWEENKKKRKKTKKKVTAMGEDEVSQSCHSTERRRKQKEKK